MDQVRKLAADLLTKIIKKRAYSGVELDKALFDSELEQRDRAFLTELVYGTLKRLITIDHIISSHSKVKLSKMEDTVLSNMRIAVYQICYLDRIPQHSAVDEAVNIVKSRSKRAVPFTNGVLRSIVRDSEKLKFGDDIRGISLKYSMPSWITELLRSQYGEITENILEGLNRDPETVIRVNTLKIKPEEYKGLLEGKGIESEMSDVLSDFLVLKNAGSVRDLPGYKEGLFSVQNISAGFVSYALKDEKGEIFMDMCAAPGGKSAYLSELKNDKILIDAHDIFEKKISLMENNLKREGIESVRCSVKDASEFDEDLFEKYDGIICDVPCSGLGIMAGKPDIRHNMTLKDTENIRKLQEKILENAGRYLKDGGLLIYSTCTLNKKENEEQVKAFLKEHSEFKTERLFSDIDLPENFMISENMITILPSGIYDGFFVTGLRKNRTDK